jgi:hypothetical protein
MPSCSAAKAVMQFLHLCEGLCEVLCFSRTSHKLGSCSRQGQGLILQETFSLFCCTSILKFGLELVVTSEATSHSVFLHGPSVAPLGISVDGFSNDEKAKLFELLLDICIHQLSKLMGF